MNFLNYVRFLRLIHAPANPPPRSNNEAGSGTAAVSSNVSVKRGPGQLGLMEWPELGSVSPALIKTVGDSDSTRNSAKLLALSKRACKDDVTSKSNRARLN